MKHRFTAFCFSTLLATCCACSQQQENTETASAQPTETAAEVQNASQQAIAPATIATPAVPETFTKLEEATGDLDNDAQNELVVVYNTPKQTDYGTERRVYIYKQEQSQWRLWHQSTGPVLPSEHGGVLGDPFEGIAIERGALVVYHHGGSSQKWSYTHRYRHRNGNWTLIGATVTSGAPCYGFETYDYNVLTGKIEADLETETCEDGVEEAVPVVTHQEKFTFTAKPAQPVQMDGFYPGENEVRIPSKPGESFHY